MTHSKGLLHLIVQQSLRTPFFFIKNNDGKRRPVPAYDADPGRSDTRTRLPLLPKL